MTEEIKRILDYLINEKAYLHYGIHREKFIELEGREVKTLLDYITNLQKENLKLGDVLEEQNRHIKEANYEIERLKNGYCELKEKCNNGECDCTNEEYDGMVESNIKLSLEVERLNNIIDELTDYLKYQIENLDFEKDTKAKMLCAMVLVMLDKEEVKESNK